RLNKRIERVEPEAIAAMQAYAWPGNIRELENLMERTLLFTEGQTVRLEDLPEPFRKAGNAPTFQPTAAATAAASLGEGDASMKDIVKGAAAALERDLISRALEETSGNVTQAAKRLKISRKSLQNKMKEFGLREP